MRYGITPEDYDHLYRQQGGVCAICKVVPPLGKPLQVDHDHETKKVRGLVCHGCNLIIGHAKDNTERLDAARAYILHHREVQAAQVANLIAFPVALDSRR